jgi:programmed cell death protein 5
MTVAQDDELTRLRQQRLAEMREQMESQALSQMQEEEQTAAEAQTKANLATAMKTVLSSEARERLARLELSRPELAEQVRQQLADLEKEGRISTPVSDLSLKRILAGLEDKKHNSSIRRI